MVLRDYIVTNIDSKIDDTINDINSASVVRQRLYNILIDYWDFLPLATNEPLVLHREDIAALYDKKYTHDYVKFSNNCVDNMVIYHKHAELIKMYIRTLICSCAKEHKLIVRLNTLKLLKKHKDVLYNFIEIINNELAKDLLRGERINLGNNVGSLQVWDINHSKKADHNYASDHGKKRINWGESKKVRAAIIAEGNIPKHKVIKEDGTIIEEGIPWIVEHNGTYSPMITIFKSYNLPHRQYYTFTPSNFCNTKERSQTKFREGVESINDILDSNKLGLRDKLFMIDQYIPNYYFKQRS